MAKTKTQQTYDLLKVNQKQIYDDFFRVHQLFATDPEKNREQFNRVGRDFIGIIRAYERRLCGGMERTNNSVYSATVSEKFWNLIRQDFPLIDQVGVVIKK